jgi:aspartyl-tRNA(Asn)/glutamyl-tRNA(Gln) amidotransferase subunit B
MRKPFIGLEIHIELRTKSKMFCSCSNNPDEKRPNFNICPVCLGHPGTLPVINLEAVKKVIKAGLALNCQITDHSKFDRKNYFYPDLPKGYQITQHDLPFCENGFLDIDGKKIKIKRIHLEEDTGSSMHLAEENCSLINFNRAGVPLMELVTEPEITSAEEAKKFAKELHLIMRYLGISEADMEKGQMRVEVNISLTGQDNQLGTKVEIKNLNSFRSVERAIDYEIKRQAEVLNKGEKVVQETRGWDDSNEKTLSQRIKEDAHDYRYFPEPDLPAFHVSKEFIQEIADQISELPQKRKERLMERYGLSGKEAVTLVYNKKLGEYFEEVVSNLPEKSSELTKLSFNYLTTDLLGLLKKNSINNKDFVISPKNFADFIKTIYQNKISSNISKIIIKEMFNTGVGPLEVIKEKNLIQIDKAEDLEKIIKKIISENKQAVEDYNSGKETAIQYLIGRVMVETKGKASPKLAETELRRFLS